MHSSRLVWLAACCLQVCRIDALSLCIPTVASITCSGLCECNPISSGSNGIISDGDGKYPARADCLWLFTTSVSVHVQFTMIDTERYWDYVSVDSCTNATCSDMISVFKNSGHDTHVHIGTRYTNEKLGTEDVWTVYNDPVNYPFLRITFKSSLSGEREGFLANWWTSPAVPDCACPVNTYRKDSQCTNCMANSGSPEGSTEISDCVCNAGFAGPDGGLCVSTMPCGAGLSGPDGGPCKNCVAGKYKLVAGSAGCTDCAANSDAPEASDDASDCTCSAGSTGSDGGVCTHCVAGKYKSVTGSAGCTDCPANSDAPEGSTDSSFCVCDAGAPGGPDGGPCVPLCITAVASINCSGSCECTPISSGSNGTISDGPGVYSPGANCVWLFTTNDRVHVQFTMIDTEWTKDSVSVDKCTNAQCSDIISVFKNTGTSYLISGYTNDILGPEQTPFTVYNDPVNYPFLRITFKSDHSLQREGFLANWWTSLTVPDCVCPVNTYKKDSQCTNCMANSGSPVGSTEISDCMCSANTYKKDSQCTNCMANSGSPEGSTEISDCMCSAACTICAANSDAPEASNSASDSTCAWLAACCPLVWSVDTQCPTKTILNPPESSRRYLGTLNDHAAMSMLDSSFAWCGKATQNPSWMTIDLLTEHYVLGVVVQGRGGHAAHYVKDFEVMYSDDGETYISSGEYEALGINVANFKREVMLTESVRTRYLKIFMHTWEEYPCMRMGVIKRCEWCKAGSTGPDDGVCTHCVAGKYKSVTGSAACTNCTANSDAPEASDDASDCTCSAGSTGPDGGVCTHCVAGKYKAVTGSAACTNCTANSDAPEASKNASDCTCSAGSTGPDGGVCTHCVAGKYKPVTGSAACTNCTANSDAPEASKNASDCTCSAGSTGPDGGVCTQCVPGKYKPVTGSAACTNCTANSDAPEASKNASDCTCNAGSTGPDGGVCTHCVAGKYKLATGSAACKNCVENSDAPEASDDASDCTCNAGSTGPDGGVCTHCVAGKYKHATGSAACTNCTANSDAPEASKKASDCLCTAGAVSQEDTCVLCSAGKYKTSRGSAACDSCDADKTSPAGASASTACVCHVGFALTTSSGSTCQAVCGDGRLVHGEGCDDGNTIAGDGCSAFCAEEYAAGYCCSGGSFTSQDTCVAGSCGDGKLAGNELCDDGNARSGDGCSNTCAQENGWHCTHMPCGQTSCTKVCGNGAQTPGEECDDGNTDAGDGCSDECAMECGYVCDASSSPQLCGTVCGDGMIAGNEACDDNNTIAADGCNGTCAVESGWECTATSTECGQSSCVGICGDGKKVASEGCDDGNTWFGDGCSGHCTVETDCGYSCGGGSLITPDVCEATRCGDGLQVGDEACDDGNTVSGDGCSSGCETEIEWSCRHRFCAPTVCSELCGNDYNTSSEECDDGNTVSGDGCSDVCAIEYGYVCDASAPQICAKVCADGKAIGARACDDDLEGCSGIGNCIIEKLKGVLFFLGGVVGAIMGTSG